MLIVSSPAYMPLYLYSCPRGMREECHAPTSPNNSRAPTHHSRMYTISVATYIYSLEYKIHF